MLRIFQRLKVDIRHLSVYMKRRLAILTAALVILVSLIFIYQEESFQYTSSSIQNISDKINLITSKIDSWNLINDYEADNEIPQDTANKETLSLALPSPTLDASEESSASESSNVVTPTKKGVLLMFARSSDLSKILNTIRTVEIRFNKEYKYDWLIVGDVQHSRNFRRTVQALTSATINFKSIPRKILTYPNGLDKNKMRDSRKEFKDRNIQFVRSQKQRHLNRFMALNIFDLEELDEYEYFMRVDPLSVISCDINFDPIDFMYRHDKTFGFGASSTKQQEFYKTLWPSVVEYIQNNPNDIHNRNLIDFVSDDKGESYNGCSFSRAFSVGKLSFFRSEKYKNFASFLDTKYGIYYEGWTDSTFYTLATILLEDQSKIQFFHSIGYSDGESLVSCPFDASVRLKNKCICNPLDDFTWNPDKGNCIEKFFKANGFPLPYYVMDAKQKLQEAKEKAKERSEQKKYEEEELQKLKQEEEEEKKKIEEQNEDENKEETKAEN